ncbi:MAG: GNAT family N-acetyltransferase [Cyanobacteria bacterium P01_F01_bin.150]
MSTAIDSWFIRLATSADVSTIFQLIQSLADYEKLSHEVVGSERLLADHLFGPHAFVEVLLAEVTEQGSLKIAGFALYFRTYSTYRTGPGIYLEDLFVKPAYRHQGIGKALFVRLAQRAIDQNYTYINWSVLDWNEMAIAFYQRIGAIINSKCRICRINGDALQQLAQQLQKFSGSQISLSSVTINPVTEQTVISLFKNIQANAAFHNDLDAVVGSSTKLQQHLFEPSPAFEAIVAVEQEQGETVGIATFSQTYSTFLTQPGLYLEDLFVPESKRKQGIGTSLLSKIAQIAVERNCGRLEWLVQYWNTDAIDFYQKNGAAILPDWRRCELADQALYALAQSASA